MKPVVFIHTNDKQMVGAIVAEYALKRNSPHRDQFDVRILHVKDYPVLAHNEGRTYVRDGNKLVWRNDNLQSFTPLRFLPPQIMGYQGRAIIMDPDIFAVGDVSELLSRDMQGKAILCRMIPPKDGGPAVYGTSLMLLECSKLTHWKWEQQIEELFSCQRDYQKWVNLKLEPEGSVGLFEDEWNHFDTLNERTKLLHNTERLTQPWKTGLPVDYYMEGARKWGLIPRPWIVRFKALLQGKGMHPHGRYQKHPDPKQEAFFFTLLKECMDQGLLTQEFLRSEIRRKHIRPDAIELVRTAGVA